jgi:hypothetical protein
MKVLRLLVAWLFNSQKGVFVGRHRTHDGKSRKEDFVCDIDAPMLKKHPAVSKAARNLWSTMRALADGKTGELTIKKNPLNWKAICRQAEIGRDTWQRLLKELLAHGLVTRTREIVEHYKGGRRRMVWGRARYFVHKRPKSIKSSMFLPMPDSPAAEESGTQIIQKHLEPSPRRGVGGCSSSVSVQRAESSSPTATADDDARVGVSNSANKKANPNPFLTGQDEALVCEVQARIRAQYPETYDRHKDRVDDVLFVVEAIAMIDGRGKSAISVPDAYFAAGIVKILDCDLDKLLIDDILARKKLLREKYMGKFETNLSPEQEQAMRQFRAMLETKGKPS